MRAWMIYGTCAVLTVFLSLRTDAQSKRVDLAEYERSFDATKPLTAVFDIDDTALFSSYAMAIAEGGFRTLHPDVGNPYSDCKFFAAVNDTLDAKFSRAKAISAALIAFHRSRGDTIVFVTKRCASAPPNDSTSHLLQRWFSLSVAPRVEFTNLDSKVNVFRGLRPSVSYGDSDSDITESIEAAKAGNFRTRVVRIIRNPLSSNLGANTPGLFGEEVLSASEW